MGLPESAPKSHPRAPRSAFRLSSRKSRGWTASIIDISDRAHAVHVRKHLVGIVDSLNPAIVSKDLNGVVVSWNKGAERIFGYSADEVVGKSITILMPPDLQDEGPNENFLTDLNERLQQVSFVAGEQFSAADITALVTTDFAKALDAIDGRPVQEPTT
jgi:PAS domain-containing protein